MPSTTNFAAFFIAVGEIFVDSRRKVVAGSTALRRRRKVVAVRVGEIARRNEKKVLRTYAFTKFTAQGSPSKTPIHWSEPTRKTKQFFFFSFFLVLDTHRCLLACFIHKLEDPAQCTDATNFLSVLPPLAAFCVCPRPLRDFPFLLLFPDPKHLRQSGRKKAQIGLQSISSVQPRPTPLSPTFSECTAMAAAAMYSMGGNWLYET
jgi:hypothetical protein